MTASPLSAGVLWPLTFLLVLMVLLLFLGRVPLRYNLRNLVVRWPMTLLTGLAFTLVISLLTVMLAFVNGMGKLTEESGHPENVIVLADGANDESFSSLPLNDTVDIAFQPGVSRIKKDARDSEGTPLCSRELFVIGTMPAAPAAGKSPGTPFRGQIRKVQLDEGVLVLMGSDGREHPVRLATAARVFVNEVESRADNLKPGDTVWAATEVRSGRVWTAEVRASHKQRFIQIRGIEDPVIAGLVHRLGLSAGQWFSPAGVATLSGAEGNPGETAVQAVIGHGLARELGQDRDPPRPLQMGDLFRLGPKSWQVVGILDSEGTTFDSEVWAKRSYVGELYDKPANISSIVLRTADAAAATALAEDLKTNYKKTNLQPLTEPEYFAKLRGVTQQLYIGIVFLTVFMAVGGIFGVMNTMFAAISQRTRDIGVLRILGYARWQILVSFLLESLGIAVIGGVLGCTLGSLCNGISATSIVGSGQGGFGKTVIFRLMVDTNTIAIGVFLSLLMGLLGGLLPSLSAMRLRPLESVR